jgi:Mrp family chromosome partitioning ATPase
MSRTAAQSPASRAEWLGARAALAGRRSGRFTLIAVATFVVVVVALIIIPRFGGSAPREPNAPEVRVDTVPLLGGLEGARHAVAHADSQFENTLLTTEYFAGETRGLTGAQRARRDSLQALALALDALLDRAAKAPLSASYRALATARALAGEARVSQYADSLAALEKRRASLDPTSGAERPFAELTTLVNDVGLAIRDIGTRRRASLAREISAIDASAGLPLDVDTAGPRRSRDNARIAAAAAESALAAARAENASAAGRETSARARMERRTPPIAVLAAAMVLAIIIGFSMSLFTEIARPTIATSHEAERAAGAPVVAVARERNRAAGVGGMDPFRMLYLGLTATGTRTRTVAISGDDRAVVATASGRLALAAAADARATLVVDTDPEGSSVAGYYSERPEPGFTDAIAGVRLWAEVTRPIGASEELAIDVVPAGSIRRDELDPETRRAARAEFARFRDQYDFCVIVAPTDTALDLLCSLMDAPAVVVCAEMGRTSLEELHMSAARIRKVGAQVHGVALWDAELPVIQSRNTLMTKTLAV